MHPGLCMALGAGECTVIVMLMQMIVLYTVVVNECKYGLCRCLCSGDDIDEE